MLIAGRLIKHFKSHESIEFMIMKTICDDFKSKNPPPAGANLPVEGAKPGLQTKP